MAEPGSPRPFSVGYVALVLAASWLACAAVLALLLGSIGLSSALMAAVLTPLILGMGWFVVWFRTYYHLFSPEERDPDAGRNSVLYGSLLTGAIAVGLGLALLLDGRAGLEGPLAFIVVGILGLDAGIAVAWRFPRRGVNRKELRLALQREGARLIAERMAKGVARDLPRTDPAAKDALWLPNRFPLSAITATEMIVVVPLVAFGVIFAIRFQSDLFNVGYGIFAAAFVAASVLSSRRTTVRAVAIAGDAVLIRYAGGRVESVPWDVVTEFSGPERVYLRNVPGYLLYYPRATGKLALATLSSDVGRRLAAELEVHRPGSPWAKETEFADEV